MIRYVRVRLPGVHVERGPADCTCGYPSEDGRHEPVEECVGDHPGYPCPKPEEHHGYRPLPWWRRIKRAEEVWW